MNSNLFNKTTISSTNTTRYTRNMPYSGKYDSKLVKYFTPFLDNDKLTNSGTKLSIVSGSYNSTTKVISYTFKAITDSVNLTTEYPFQTFPTGCTGKVHLFLNFYKDNSFKVGNSINNIGTFTITNGITSVSTISRAVTFTLMGGDFINCNNIHLSLKFEIYDVSGNLILVDDYKIEKSVDFSVYFPATGNSTSNADMIDTVIPNMKVIKSVDAYGWEFSKNPPAWGFGSFNSKDFCSYFKMLDYTTIAVLNFMMPDTIASDSFIIISVTPESDSNYYTTSKTVYGSPIGKPIYYKEPSTAERTEEYNVFTAANYGHRSNYIIVYPPNTTNTATLYNTVTNIDDLILVNKQEASRYYNLFYKYYKASAFNIPLYIPLAGLKPNIKYTIRAHAAKYATDKVFEVNGKSLWISKPFSSIPDSATIWADGVSRSWTTLANPKPSGFDTKAYREMKSNNNMIIVSGTGCVSEIQYTTPLNYKTALDFCAIPYNISFVNTDADLTAEATTLTLTWDSVVDLISPTAWAINIEIGYTPMYTKEYIIEYSTTSSTISSKYGNVSYTRTNNTTYYTHQLVIPAVQVKKSVQARAKIEGVLSDGTRY